MFLRMYMTRSTLTATDLMKQNLLLFLFMNHLTLTKKEKLPTCNGIVTGQAL